jgi:alkyldihydroxyacetonephosphate synthase
LISTRSSGQLSTYYGNVEDLVVSLTVMLPDGTVCTARPGPRSAVGPKLDELFIGAEGGLGVVLEALLRVHRLPERVIGRGYDFESIDAGLEAMRRIVQRDIRPYVMRLYDHEDTAFQHSDARGCLLVVATAGATGVAEAAAAVVGAECEAATDLGEAPFERWHDHRFSLSAELLEGMLANAGSFVDTIEVAAAWDRLPGLHARVKEVLAVQGLGLCHFSHAYPQGCCAYFTFAGSAASEPEAEAAYEGCWRGTMEAALAAEATIGHHHGAGQVRAPWVQAEMGGWWQVWQKVRSALDPSGTMNPHAVGGAPPPPA